MKEKSWLDKTLFGSGVRTAGTAVGLVVIGYIGQRAIDKAREVYSPPAQQNKNENANATVKVPVGGMVFECKPEIQHPQTGQKAVLTFKELPCPQVKIK